MQGHLALLVGRNLSRSDAPVLIIVVTTPLVHNTTDLPDYPISRLGACFYARTFHEYVCMYVCMYGHHI